MKQMKHKARILLVLALALVLACAFFSLAFAEGESAAAAADMNSGGLPGRRPQRGHCRHWRRHRRGRGRPAAMAL